MTVLINILLSVLTIVFTPQPSTAHDNEDVQDVMQSLITAYENNDHDAFVDAFPSSYVDYSKLFYYNPKIKPQNNLYFQALDYCKYLLLGKNAFDSKILDKLVVLSKDYRYHFEDVDFSLIYYLRSFINKYDQDTAKYLETKDDAEVISFLRMTFQDYIPCSERRRRILYIQKDLFEYSERLRPLIDVAYKLALIDSAYILDPSEAPSTSDMLTSILMIDDTDSTDLSYDEKELQIKKQLLINAYEHGDHESFVEAFPSSFGAFYHCFISEDKPLYFQRVDYCKYFILGGTGYDSKIIDKLISISNGFHYYLINSHFAVIEFTREYLNKYPQEVAKYLETKDDEEVISFFRMAFQSFIPCDEHEAILIIQTNLSEFSSRLSSLMDKAYIYALIDSANIWDTYYGVCRVNDNYDFESSPYGDK